MAKYHNKKDTKKIGLRIKALRESKELSIEDVSLMTGFTRNSIKGIEAGSNSDISHFIEVAKAIGVHPKDVLDVPMDMKSRYKLPPKRQENDKLTLRLTLVVSKTDFFMEPKSTKDVVEYFSGEMAISANPKIISNVLIRLVGLGLLKSFKVGRQYRYFKIE